MWSWQEQKGRREAIMALSAMKKGTRCYPMSGGSCGIALVIGSRETVVASGSAALGSQDRRDRFFRASACGRCFGFGSRFFLWPDW
jgi:hypothetical protein